MRPQVDLYYDADSLVGPLDKNEIDRFEHWLGASGYGEVHFDPSYIDHLSKHHGGVPGKCHFQTALGSKQRVKRFLNFLNSNSNDPLALYSVVNTWSQVSDRMGSYLMPFGELCAGDLLCFDYEHAGRPRVVVWHHEKSHTGQRPYIEYVAKDFDAFLLMLTDSP
jgi:hypothetical protein